MITNYYVLRALAVEWAVAFEDAVFSEAYSHLPAELTLSFDRNDGTSLGLRVGTSPGRCYVCAVNEPRRPRSNVVSLFEPASGQAVSRVEINEHDRILSFELVDDRRFEIHPYGSRPNVLLVSGDNVSDAFKHRQNLVGKQPPAARETTSPSDRVHLQRALDGLDGPLERRLRRIFPQLGSELSRELAFRGVNDLWTALEGMLAELKDPSPLAYDLEDRLLFSPIELTNLQAEPAHRFDTMDEGVRWMVRRRGRTRYLNSIRGPILAALQRSSERWSRRVVDLERAQTSPSRADMYEGWGHLLMASPGSAAPGDREVCLPNILGDGEEVTIPLDPERTLIQNAERYYARARGMREERLRLEDRLREARARLVEATTLLDELDKLVSPREVDRFRKSKHDLLARHIGGKTEAVASTPFRRFRLHGSFEVWVGRNARENDSLTFDHAARHDLWMHARGVPGSHVILKTGGRSTEVPSEIRSAAASIAAWFSGARGSSLVPVQVAQRKHVTKPRGAGPGVVRVHQEEVVLVEPKLPDRT